LQAKFDEMDDIVAGAAHAYLAAIVESSDDAILSKDLTASSAPATPARSGILARIRAAQRLEHFETVLVTSR